MSLPAKPTDGQLATIKLGEGATTSYIWLRWNASRERWVSNEWTAVRSIDQVGVHLALEPFTTKQYVPIDNSPTYSNDFSSPSKVGAAFAAGLTMEYRHSAWCAGNGSKVHVGAYFYELDDGDFNTPSGESNTKDNYTTPPTRGWAETAYLVGSSTVVTDRTWAQSGWNVLNAPGGGVASASKNAMYAAMYAFMDPGFSGSALVFDYSLWLRWAL